MGSMNEDMIEAARLPEGDAIRILLEQHAQIRELFTVVKSSTAQDKQRAFDELRALLAVHETAEEMVLRPVSAQTAGRAIASARNDEEAEANKVLAALEKMDCGSGEFDALFASFEVAVDQHARNEETEEFPRVLAECDDDRRALMGTQIEAAESIAPTHPHPSVAGSPVAQWAVGPFASLVDRTKDAIAKAMR